MPRPRRSGPRKSRVQSARIADASRQQPVPKIVSCPSSMTTKSRAAPILQCFTSPVARMKRTARLGPGFPPVLPPGSCHARKTPTCAAVTSSTPSKAGCDTSTGAESRTACRGLSQGSAGTGRKWSSRCSSRPARRTRRKQEFGWVLDQLGTGYVDIATLYYVESETEWTENYRPRRRLGGAGCPQTLRRAQDDRADEPPAGIGRGVGEDKKPIKRGGEG